MTGEAGTVVRKPDARFPYSKFQEAEGIPIHRALIGVADVVALPREPWPRTGGRGTFIELEGTFQSERGVYVADIPGGGALEPEKHLYDEEIFILQGRGVTQVWQGDREKLTFEWGPGSVFAFPPNTTHRLMNGSQQEVVFMGVTRAPQVMNALGNLDLIFNSDFRFLDLYAQGDNYFLLREVRKKENELSFGSLFTNFIPDVRHVLLDDSERKVAGGQLTVYRMGERFPHGHISQWPTGRYHKAHYHGPGAILLGLDGEGYVLAWDTKLGTRPYKGGHGDQVHRVEWGQNSIYCPPNAYFHMHINSGAGPARHVAVYGEYLPLGVHDMSEEIGYKGLKSVRDGGTMIDYEDEDPQIREDFEGTLRAKGLECTMPPVTYRD
jgi:oxalate decarboxylase/phosphoglucose isomerase-like protein (cupin superfamily)